MLTGKEKYYSVKHDCRYFLASNIKEIMGILLEEDSLRGFDVIEDGKQNIRTLKA